MGKYLGSELKPMASGEVSHAERERDGRPSGVWYAVAAGTTFGIFTILASQLSDGLIVTPVVLVRFASIAAITAWVVLGRREWRVPRRLLPALFGGMDE